MSALLTNPLALKMAMVAVFGFLFFVFGVLIIRQLRKEMVKPEEADNKRVQDASSFAFAAYEGVIRKMKEQEAELERLRRAERERASESANISGAVFSNLTSGVLLFTPALMVKQANPAAKSLLGFGTLGGMHARDIFRGARASIQEQQVSTERESDLISALQACAESGAPMRRLEVNHVTPQGEPRTLGVTLSPVRGPSDEKLGVACLVSDLTEISRLNQQLRVREKMAALGEMSAGIAHEFKNSLATISGYAQMLKSETDPTVTAEFARNLEAETASLARIVTDFLNFARPQGVASEPLPLRKMLEDCAREAGVRLRAESVPPDLQILGDPTAMRQVFSNLLRNSAEAAREGASPEVEAKAQVQGATEVSLELRDNGQGIPSEELGKVFLPFFTTKASGTGLGLALVHRVVIEHGGKITLESGAHESTGTTVHITLPGKTAGSEG